MRVLLGFRVQALTEHLGSKASLVRRIPNINNPSENNPPFWSECTRSHHALRRLHVSTLNVEGLVQGLRLSELVATLSARVLGNSYTA